MSRHPLLPVFLAGDGCPLGCVYCDQRAQTGAARRMGAAEPFEVVRWARERGAPSLELGLYGGTFTGLPVARQEEILGAVRETRRRGWVHAVRVSTHPRWLDAPSLDRLARHGVETIEVGVQSLDDRVLRRSRRGIDAQATLVGLARVRRHGFRLGVQLMVGLPGSSRSSDRRTAEGLGSVGASLARVYPTVVLHGTELDARWREGVYRPLSLAEATVRAADQVAALEGAGVLVQRIGLHVDAAVRAAWRAGPLDPAFGERVRSALAPRRLLPLLGGRTPDGPLTLRVPLREGSQWVGHRRVNLRRLARRFGPGRVCVREDAELPPGRLGLERRR